MEPLRILFLVSGLGAGGAENHLLSLGRYLARAGHEPSVCTLDRSEGGLEAAFIREGIPLFRLPLGSLGRLAAPRFVSGLRRVLAASRPDAVHGHLYHAEIVAGLASFLSSAPVLTTRHSAGIEFRGSRALVARAFARRFASCVAVSDEAAREAVETGFRPGIVQVLPNAVDPDRFQPVPSPERRRRRDALLAALFPGADPTGVLLAGSVGGLREVKNFPLLVRAAARLARGSDGGKVPSLRFVIFGEGRERGTIEAVARALEIEDRLSLPGHRGDLAEIYPLLDIFALPSSREGVPLALLEAMSSGVACVATAVGGVPGVLAEAGLLVPPDDEGALAAAIGSLAEDDRARFELGRLARVRVLERYSLEIWGERMLEIYRAAAGRGRGRSGGSRGQEN